MYDIQSPFFSAGHSVSSSKYEYFDLYFLATDPAMYFKFSSVESLWLNNSTALN